VLSRNKIKIIGDISYLKKIEKLSLAGNRIREIDNITKLLYLKDLKLNNNKITVIPKNFTKNTRLRFLDLGNNRLTKIIELRKFLNLIHLNVWNNPIMSSKKNEEILKNFPRLEIFNQRKVEGARRSRKYRRRVNSKR